MISILLNTYKGIIFKLAQGIPLNDRQKAEVENIINKYRGKNEEKH